MARIFISSELPGAGFAALAAESGVGVWRGSAPIGSAPLRADLADCEVWICLLTHRVDAALLDAAPRLRCVSTVSVGVDHIDVATCTARGIAIGHTPGVLTDTTADLTFALMLAAARRVAEGDRYIRDGQWGSVAWSPEFFLGADVSGATLGIIGLGAIGQAVARRAAGFDMQVLGWSRSARAVVGVTTVTLPELLASSDFVCVTVALADETRGLIDARAIARMKRGAVLVNTARGGIIDETALAAALRSGQLAAAALDVFAREPLPADSPLLGLQNLVMTPHVGSATASTRAKMADLAVANARAALAGEWLPHCANPEVYAADPNP